MCVAGSVCPSVDRGWLVGLALVCASVCAFVSAFVCGLLACVLSWVEILIKERECNTARWHYLGRKQIK